MISELSCPSKNTQEEYEENLEDMLSKNGLHKSMIAKKFHETRMDVSSFDISAGYIF